ncbi:YjiH family protein [Paraclostridium sordellii]|uniref:YjiH family protein n=1 Tax=Paraclostridium sordellii TaxID=1505 RepID=UPI0005E8BCDD|nr:YjiH family protein [Paeniclostridium sordellii]CEO20755.1 nucleoside recognition domain-containing protein [[Clostridium] sordellii] [Paeniclostridium sordellii]
MEKDINFVQNKSSSFFKFLIPSLIGLLLFVIPLPYGKFVPIEGISSINIGIGFLAEILKISFANYLNHIALVVIVTSAILSILSKFVNIKNEFLKSVLDVPLFWLVFRILGAIFISMTVLNFGPTFIRSEVTGQTILGVLPSLLAIFLVSGFLLPLVVDFGLMDFVGTLISKFMYKIFKVPGRSAVDAISSWLGDGTLGIMITNTQYKQGFYTAREACIISVCFSLVSLPFSTVIADQLGLMNLFVPFYGTVCVASLACAIIMPRVYPLAHIKDKTYNDVDHLKEDIIPDGENLFEFALGKALYRAENSPSLNTILKNGFKTVIDMYLALLPLVMAWGTVALMVAEFTPLFNWISFPIVFVLKLLQVPNAIEAAPAVLVGFADMFLPSIMVSGDTFDILTKFIIGALSITQLLYLTETGAVILKSDIPLNLKDLFLVFLVRTMISLPIIVLLAKFILK